MQAAQIMSMKESIKTTISMLAESNPNMLVALSYCKPPDLLTLFREHMYCLFLLLCYYGEPEHKNKALNKIRHCLHLCEEERDEESLLRNFIGGCQIQDPSKNDTLKSFKINQRKAVALHYL